MTSTAGTNLLSKYQKLHDEGWIVLAAAVRSHVSNVRFGSSDFLNHFWNNHFTCRISRCLPEPMQGAFEHDWATELSPRYDYHFYGVIAMPAEVGQFVWHGGALCGRVADDLESLKVRSPYREICIEDYSIEPSPSWHAMNAWVEHIAKTKEYVAGAEYQRRVAALGRAEVASIIGTDGVCWNERGGRSLRDVLEVWHQ